MSEEKLEYLEVIEFAIQNISRIQSVTEIKEHWPHKIADITESRHNLLRADPVAFISATHKFVGQENFFFAFREARFLIGEFSVDFLPVNSNEYLREQMRLMAKKQKAEASSKMRIVNWRVQLFAQRLFPSLLIGKKYFPTLSWLERKLGEPNSDELTAGWASVARSSNGQAINFWRYETPRQDYTATFYKLEGQPSISFSISEVM